MNIFIAFILLLLTLSYNNSFSQNKFKIEFGGGLVNNTFQNGELEYWDVGWLIKFNGLVKVTPKILLTTTLAYQNHIFSS